MFRLFSNSNRQRGASLTEYSVMLALLALVIAPSALTTGQATLNSFSTTNALISSNSGQSGLGDGEYNAAFFEGGGDSYGQAQNGGNYLTGLGGGTSTTGNGEISGGANQAIGGTDDSDDQNGNDNSNNGNNSGNSNSEGTDDPTG